MININIKSTNFNMTPDIEQMVREKVNLVDRFLNLDDVETALAEVEIARSTHHKKGEVFKCEINLSFKGRVVRVVTKNYDIRVAIDDARSELEKRIRRSKGKRFDIFKKGARKLKNLMRRTNNE
jgi:ribosomal subunit interface protein